MVCPPVPPAWFLDTHSGAVQSVCAIAALVVVIAYTCFTWTIRQATVRQAIAAQRPLLVLEWEDNEEMEADAEPRNENVVYIENRGNGPALGVFWRFDERRLPGENQQWHEIGALAVGDWSDLPNETEPELYAVPDNGLRLHYKDMAGNYYYCTRVFHRSGTISQNSETLAKRDCSHIEINKFSLGHAAKCL